MGDWNAHSHSWDETRDKNSRGKIKEKWMVGIGWLAMEGDSRLTCERTREGRRESSRIDFVMSKDNFDWLRISFTKL